MLHACTVRAVCYLVILNIVVTPSPSSPTPPKKPLLSACFFASAVLISASQRKPRRTAMDPHDSLQSRNSVSSRTELAPLDFLHPACLPSCPSALLPWRWLVAGWKGGFQKPAGRLSLACSPLRLFRFYISFSSPGACATLLPSLFLFFAPSP